MNALHVTFRVGEADYAIPVTDVLHLDSYEGATRVPGVPAYVAGLVQVRGRVVPVVDLRARFGLSPAERTADSRVVVVQIGTRIAGLLADSARDVMQLDSTKFEKPPDMIERQSQGFVRAVVSVAKRLILLVDVPRVIGEELSHGG
jgi:purine-binding chemotaxis protein CheW